MRDDRLGAGWISIADRKPIEQKDFSGVFQWVDVIASGGGEVCKMTYQAGKSGGYWSAFSSYGEINAEKVTHWQPLPAPPEERK